MIFKPMLATDAVLDNLRYSVLASPKLDGIRAIVRGGVVYSRSNKPIANKYVQSLFSKFEHYDGELIVGEPTAHDVYRKTTSGVMSADGEPDVRFFIFDHVGSTSSPYRHRALQLTVPSKKSRLVLHEQKEIFDPDQLLFYEQSCLNEGYEGLILRDPNAPYKMGRSTVKEGYLLKVKRFVDAEATVIGFEERMRNENEATISELGRTKRSSHKAGKSGRGDLGALVCRSEGIIFNVGTGFSDGERAAIWANRDQFLGQLAKYKFFPVGVKEAPRHPVFLGWRDRRDV